MLVIKLVQAFLTANRLLFSGRLHFPRHRIGQTIKGEDCQDFVIFREASVDADGDPAQPHASFIVRFHVAGMSPSVNKLFSFLPMPFCVGCPGFRSKLWTLNERTGDFQGVYTWATMQDAENYAGSVALTFMTRRSVPGSVSYQIRPLTH